MIRKEKVKKLTEAGLNIRVYEQRPGDRFRIEAIYLNGKWYRYNTTSPDQAAAGKVIDTLYEEVFYGGNSN